MQSELQENTPWNTYVNLGLPPTPISNPGKESILAAVDPETTDFIYFVADGDGGHKFAKNLEEHNKNVREWRLIEKNRVNSAVE